MTKSLFWAEEERACTKTFGLLGHYLDDKYNCVFFVVVQCQSIRSHRETINNNDMVILLTIQVDIGADGWTGEKSVVL